MDRRQFLRRLTVGAASVALATVVDPELLDWKPGQKAFSLPPVKRFDDLVPTIYDRDIALDPQAFLRIMDNQMSIRLLREYAFEADKYPSRIDMVMGWAIVRPDYAVRLVVV